MKSSVECAWVWKVKKVENDKLMCSVQGGSSHLYLNDILTFAKPTLQS